MKNKKTKRIVILSIALIILSLLMLLTQQFIKRERSFVASSTPQPTPVAEALPTKWSKEEWTANHKINPDYVGTLRFASGLLQQEIVQGATNDSYLRTNWKTKEYDPEGTCFLDATSVYQSTNNHQEDKNIVIYGHYVYPEYDASQTHMFTPLHMLKEKKNYEKNKYVYFLLENEVRRYQIAETFYVELSYDADQKAYLYTPNDMDYYFPHFTAKYLEDYQKAIEASIAKYNVGISSKETGVSFNENDSLLTLQTCVENHDELRLIIICKEMARYPLS